MAAPTRPPVATPDTGPPVDLDRPEPSLGELITRATGDLSQLLRDEVELAKVEITEEVKRAGRAGAYIGGAGAMGYLAVTLLCFAAAWGLAEVVPEGVAFLIVAVAVGLVATVMFVLGRQQAEHVEPVPRQTVESIKEDVEWARQLRS
jgi:hypothetical protein